MAQKVLVQLTDDIDGSEAQQTVPFGLDGVSYEIDLSDENADDLRDALAQYVSAARRVGGRKVRLAAGQSASAAAPSAPVDRERSRAIRAWAVENGYAVSDRGRIPTEVVEAFEQAESAPQEAEAPRKRKSRKKSAA
ncbi:Lsr2 family protein [Amycolatopsis sp. NPDC059021]|uniref:histone-like nucleoid-structuring protein Lsr2 n=1 Tax=Amycolatopsis sp. NPDC059021 TaxID=3346704 RepID=UPI00366D92D3